MGGGWVGLVGRGRIQYTLITFPSSLCCFNIYFSCIQNRDPFGLKETPPSKWFLGSCLKPDAVLHGRKFWQNTRFWSVFFNISQISTQTQKPTKNFSPLWCECFYCCYKFMQHLANFNEWIIQSWSTESNAFDNQSKL